MSCIGNKSSDIGGFARRGGPVNSIAVKSKIHFEINVDATNMVGLKISSKLLKLAKAVRGGLKEDNN
jgi:hypothetical protein